MHIKFLFFKKGGKNPLNRDGVLFRGQINLLHLLNISKSASKYFCMYDHLKECENDGFVTALKRDNRFILAVCVISSQSVLHVSHCYTNV